MSGAPSGTQFDAFISIVVPVRDAAEYIEQAVAEIDLVVRESFQHYEIVLVDDASTDGTVATVERLQRRVENVQLFCLNRRSGLDVALVAGLDNSIGDFVITLNVQTDPASLIPRLWELAQHGSQVVCGVRTGLPQRGLYSWASQAFYALLEAATGLRIRPGISDLRLYSRQAVSYITQNNDRHLMLRVLPFFSSHRVETMEYTPVRRGHGFGRRGPSSAVLSGITILLAGSSLPLRLMTMLALLASSLSLLFAVYVVAVALLKRHVVEGWISLALPMSVMFFLISTLLGILAEYIYMLAQQIGNRPVYLVTKESTSSVLQIRQKLNVVNASGNLEEITLSGGSSQTETGLSETHARAETLVSRQAEPGPTRG